MTDTPYEPSYTVRTFCEAEHISRPKYHELKNQGRGPREMRSGGAIRITHRARLDWQKMMEQPTAEQLLVDERLRERSRANAAKAVASAKHISKTRRSA